VDSRSLSVLSLCAGVGGLDLGIRMAQPNARTVCFVEIEAFACEILATRMDSPRLCFFENVPGHLRLGFEQVHDDLSSLGYCVKAGLFSAAEVGASHKRERFFILAYRESDRTDGWLSHLQEIQRTIGCGDAIEPSGSSEAYVANSKSVLGEWPVQKGNRGKQPLTSTVIKSHHSHPDQTEIGTKSPPVLNPQFVEWLMGWPIGWTEFEPVETVSSHWLPLMRGQLLQLQEMENNFHDRQSKS